ncbi:MAG: preprotein translocase subunit SecG [Pseudomonadota bacterium]
MEHVLLVVQVIIAIGLIGMVLIQRSESDGFGLGGGGGSFMSGRSKANLLTRTTAVLAALFIINSLALSVIAAHGRAPSITETIDAQQTTESKAVPSVPLAGADAKKAAEKVAVPAEAKKPVVKTDESTEAPVTEKKAVKKPQVKAADETPAEPDHNNE